MKPGRRRLIWLAGAALVVAVALWWFLPQGSNAPPSPVKWTPQPDSFPLGTILQGGTVEMSVGLLSDVKMASQPTWFSRLPLQLGQFAAWSFHRSRAASIRRTWKMQVEAPDFLQVNQTEVGYHPTHGPFPNVTMQLANVEPGKYDGQIRVHLIGRGYQTNTVQIRVSATVRAGPPRWRVLLASSPFECYATGSGRDFEPLTAITTRLAEEGVQLNFFHELPASLQGYDVVLVGGSTLVSGLDQANFTNRLHRFVANGGRLIVAANAFYVGTTPTANAFMKPYGLEMDTKETQPSELKIQEIVPDRLTAGVMELNFWRGVYLWSTDNRQGKVLALRKGDAEIGFLGVSRAAGRGDVILVAQSLWWHRLGGNDVHADNARMMENLLGP